MSYDLAIQVEGLGKCYHLYDRPRDRLTQFLMPRLRALSGAPQKQYAREFWALRDVSFAVRKGESVGILGRNGSGKSTLLQLITGTLLPTTGTVRTNGTVSALLELGAGFNPEFTGRENVYLAAALQGYSASQVEEKFESIAAFADIGSFMDMPVKTYSSGMYARLAFATAIHHVPEILIVDEILAVGDSAFQQKCIKRLYRMLDDGVSVLLVSHDAYQVRSICQKALLLEAGQQKFFGTAARAMDAYLASLAQVQSGETRAAPAKDEPSGANAVASNDTSAAFSVSISDVVMKSAADTPTDSIESGDPVALEFTYRLLGTYEGDLSFVVNLYREDDVYVFGTTTRMRGIAPFPACQAARIRVEFPSLPLVSGRYRWRVAVNDGGGLHILAEAVPVCAFEVNDDFRAVGLIDLEHRWSTYEVV